MLRRLKLKRKKKGKAEEEGRGGDGGQTTSDGKQDLEGNSSSTAPATTAQALGMATAEPSYKVILCGEYGVGKSSIFRRFLHPHTPSPIPTTTPTTNTTPPTATNSGDVCLRNSSSQNHRSTVGLDQCTRPFTVENTPVKLTMWDTGGMERMSFIGASYYRGANAALLVYDCGNKETFSILSQYILDIAMNAEGAKIFLCGNDSGEEEPRDYKEKVNEADMDQFMGECGDMLSGVYTVSCRDGRGLEDMFQDMAKVLHMDAIKRITLPRDVIRPAETPPPQEQSSQCAC